MRAVDAADRLGSLLGELGVDARRRSAREWAVPLPSEARGRVTVGVTCAERTVRFALFVMRAPDRAHAEVYRMLLRRNLDLDHWAFALDDDGDVHLRACIPAEDLTAARLDDLLGLLVSVVDAAYEGILRTGFEVPEGVRVTGPPPAPPPG
jgi:hypothetical protein